MTESNDQEKGPKPAPKGFGPSDAEWFNEHGGAPVAEDYVDPGLAELEGPGDFGQRLVFFTVAIMALVLGIQFLPELRYYFSNSQPLDLNAGSEDPMQLAPQWIKDGQLALPSGSYVQVAGVTERSARSGSRVHYKLAGTQLYVSTVDVDDRPRVLRDEPRTVSRADESLRAAYEGAGRLVAFRDLPERYETLINHYADNYATEFCGFKAAEAVESYQYRLREETRQRLATSLGRLPTDAELAAELGPTFECVEGYLLIDGETPDKMWIYLPMYAGFLAVIVGSAFYFRRRARNVSGAPSPTGPPSPASK